MYEIEDLSIPISRFCPGKCLNCNLYLDDPKISEEIDLSFYEKILQAKSLKDTFYYSLTGGESQLSPKFIPILELIAKYHPESMIHSNVSGWHLKHHLEVATKGIELFGKKNFRIDISVDGIQEDYEKVRLTKDGWNKAMQTATELKMLGLKPTFVMIVYKQNYKSIEKFVDFCHKMDVNWYIGFFVESENFNNIGKVQYYTNQEIQEIEISLKNIGFMETKHYSNWLWAKSIYTKTIPEFECYMGKKSILIDAYGNVYPCGGAQESHLNDILTMGNIADFQGDLDTLLYSEKALGVLDTIRTKKCQPCDLLCAHKIKFPWGNHTGMV